MHIIVLIEVHAGFKYVFPFLSPFFSLSCPLCPSLLCRLAGKHAVTWYKLLSNICTHKVNREVSQNSVRIPIFCVWQSRHLSQTQANDMLTENTAERNGEHNLLRTHLQFRLLLWMQKLFGISLPSCFQCNSWRCIPGHLGLENTFIWTKPGQDLQF